MDGRAKVTFRATSLRFGSIWSLVGWFIWAALLGPDSQLAFAQRIRFGASNPVPSSPPSNSALYQPPSLGGFPGTPNAAQPLIPLGNPTFSSPVFPGSASGGTPLPGTMATPTFDPYSPALRPNSSTAFPSNSSGFTNPFGNVFGSGPVLPGSYSNSAPIFPNNYPSSVYPNTAPPALFPGGAPNSSWGSPNSSWGAPSSSSWFNWGGNNSGWGNSGWGNNGLGWGTNTFGQPNSGLGNGWYNMPSGPLFGNAAPQPMRFFLGPRFRHTWVQSDDDPTSLETNDSDVSLVFAIPNFLSSTQPLYVVPSFSMHTFEGPRLASAEIPANAYSGFLDLGWESDPVRTFGAELGVRTGVFTDFDTFTSDSFRVMGKALGRIRLTPNATLRAGVFYIDRNRYKLVPAGGILWVPNPETRFDIFFPEPKLAHYLTTLGTTDIWWYLTGYYGGGTWTVSRVGKGEDSIDINEARLALGLDFGSNDFLRQGRRLYFIEAGYAFNRELLFRYNPADNTDLKDAFVLRAGFGY